MKGLTDQELEQLLSEDNEDNILLFDDPNIISEAGINTATPPQCIGDTFSDQTNNLEIVLNNVNVTEPMDIEKDLVSVPEDLPVMQHFDAIIIEEPLLPILDEPQYYEETNNFNGIHDIERNGNTEEENRVLKDIGNTGSDTSDEEVLVGSKRNTRNVNKYRRMKGIAYRGVKKDKHGHYKLTENRQNRKLGETCVSKKCENSKNKFCHRFDENTRKAIFKYFWKKLDWNARKHYVVGLIDVKPPKRIISENSTRTVTYQYHLKTLQSDKLQICKKMFLNTLGLTNCMVDDWCKKAFCGMTEINYRTPSRGHEKKNKFMESHNLLNTFLDELPKLESHYCRASTQKLYLEPLYETVADVYRVYKSYLWDKNSKPLSKTVFHKIFEEKNLKIHHPKKDQCDLCIGYNLGHVPENDYQLHIELKELARRQKENDKKRAQENPEECVVFTADVEAVLLSPFLKASAIYYKTKLCVHNYTIFNLVTKDATCYLWDESEGGLEASVFATLLIKHLDNYLSDHLNTKEIILYTDGCGYQNRSTVLANALFHFAREKNLKIIHNYLEKGHTQMEVDSVHSSIERKKKNREIYLPTDYIAICREARRKQPYYVKYLSYTDFKNYTGIKYYSSIRPGLRAGDPTVSDIRSLRYDQMSIKYKLNYKDEHYRDFRQKPKLNYNHTIMPLYKKNPVITQSKYEHLQALKTVISETAWNYYDNLAYK